MSDKTNLQFVDTNVLVYAHDASTGIRHEIATAVLQDLWNTEVGCMSIQVLQELYVTLTRKIVEPFTPDRAAQVVNDLGKWRVHSPLVKDVHAAIGIQIRYGISFWDAMVIRSAVQMGCERVWSEDLNSGQKYEGVLVLNPFVNSR
ncbi:PIN domain-containing protein [bacterium]|nr:PIN domain-containing protein [bacterium]